MAAGRDRLRRAIHPRILIHWVALRNRIGGEAELRLVAQLCDRRRVSIDVGASMGTYALAMRPRSRAVILLEPDPTSAHWLRRAFGSSVDIREIAASDSDGTAVLRIPREPARRGMATVDPRNDLGGVDMEGVDVATRRLDGLALGRTALVKIDVEGHESAVIRGATGIIERDHPAFIIEAEERHRPGSVRDVHQALSRYGYEGWYLDGRQLHPMSEFNAERDQSADAVVGGRKVPGRTYINNFIFVHRDDERRQESLRRNAPNVGPPDDVRQRPTTSPARRSPSSRSG